ncbi:hypothetical protein ACIGB6_18150 [Paeniglutamicibacter gangotriensis]|uniref:hypothetical protein n=1 Tax=Paeniglutamicibacter gangotriensis TaxID=254787 RepID=UPI0037C7FCF6
MSNFHSSQAEYDDPEFKNGLYADRGETDKPGVQDLVACLEASRAEVEQLTKLNKSVANQVRDHSDRVHESVRPIQAEAWDHGAQVALRSEGYALTDYADVLLSNPYRADHAEKP